MGVGIGAIGPGIGGSTSGGGGGSGTVTSVSVVTANGFSGTVANATTTPAITLTGSPSGIGAMKNLVRTANKTSAYNAAASDFVAADISGGSFTITLPTAPADQTIIAAKIVVPTTAAAAAILSVVTGGSDVFDNAAGVTTQTMKLQGEERAWIYQTSSAIWSTWGGHLPIALLAPARVVSKSAIYTAVAGEIVLCTAGAGGFTVTVPIGLENQTIVKKVDSGAGTITISPASGTIDGAASIAVTTRYQSYTIVGDGTNGNVI
jgi:hypothetical protein